MITLARFDRSARALGGVFLRVEERVNDDAVPRRVLISRQICGDIDPTREADEFPMSSQASTESK
jgi:hypothetical protein